MVFAVIISGKQAEKCLISQFFCVSPSPVLEHRRRFEQLIVAQVLDALRFSAQRHTRFAPLDLHASTADMVSSASDANAQLPTAASLDRVSGDSAAESAAASAMSNAAVGTNNSVGGGGVGGGSGGTASAVAATASASGTSIHAESGAFALDLSLCDATERSWLADVVAERRRRRTTDAPAAGQSVDDDDGGEVIDDEPRFFVIWRAIYATCFTLVCDEIDNRQLAVRWLDVIARVIAEHFRNAFILQTPDALLSQPGEIHCLLHQLLPSGQLLFNAEVFQNTND
jgi:hypothetical protein